MVTEKEEPITGRMRYDPEANIEFWGITYDSETSAWVEAGVFSLAGAHEIITVTGSAIALLSLSIMF